MENEVKQMVKEEGGANMEKAMVVFSGGIDSTTCLAMAIEKHGKDNVVAISFTYGQKHSIELECAKKITEYYGVKHIIRDLSEVYKGNKTCKLLKGNEEVEHTRYEEQTEANGHHAVDTYVPFRNGLMLSYAAALAIEENVSVIYYGSHADDAEGNAYPDCSIAFNEAMGKAIFEGTGGEVRVEGLIINLHKNEVIAKGLELEAPYNLTWSCYEGKDKPCGTCPSCRKRIESFLANGVLDPVDYEDDTYNRLEGNNE